MLHETPDCVQLPLRPTGGECLILRDRFGPVCRFNGCEVAVTETTHCTAEKFVKKIYFRVRISGREVKDEQGLLCVARLQQQPCPLRR